MSAYLSYMNAFGTDLHKIAVWEPGVSIVLGDYGQVHNHRWEKLGNLWDLIPQADPTLRDFETSTLESLSLGNSEMISGNSNASYSGVAGDVSLTIRLSKDHSVFVRALNCKTLSLKRVQRIADVLGSVTNWRRDWTLVNEVRLAQQFLVLIGADAGGEVRVTAKTPENLDAFVGGHVTAGAELQTNGSEILQYVGRTEGPIHMPLTQFRGRLWGGRSTKQVEFAEGKPGANPVWVENVDPLDFVRALGHKQV